MPILVRNVPLISPVFLNRFPVFPFLCHFFLCIVHLKRPSYLSLLFYVTLLSTGYIFPFLPCFLLLFFPQLYVKLPQTTTWPSSISFSLEWFLCLLYNVTNLCLPHLVAWIYSSLPLSIIRDLIYIIPEWPRSFPYFLQFKPEFCNKEPMIWATRSCFYCLWRASPSLP